MAFPLLFGTTPGSKGWIIYINRNSAQNFPQFCSYFLIRIDREVSGESTRMLCFRYVAIGLGLGVQVVVRDFGKKSYKCGISAYIC